MSDKLQFVEVFGSVRLVEASDKLKFIRHFQLHFALLPSLPAASVLAALLYRNAKRRGRILLVNSENVRQTSVCRSFRQYAIGGSQRQTEVCRTFPPHIRPTPEFASSIPSARTPKAPPIQFTCRPQLFEACT